MPPECRPEPWNRFFAELDAGLPRKVELHCLGGFVMSLLYGMPRPTADVDVVSVIPNQELTLIEDMAGPGSPLHKKYGIHLQWVAVATVPENYAERLVEIFPGRYKQLRIRGLEAYDLALSKLERNAARDREDLKYLARTIPLDFALLERRYRSELRPYLSNPERHDLTMQLWRDMLAGS